MLDSKLLRTELDETAAKLARRGFKLDVETIRKLEEQRKSIQVEVENLQSTRNSISKQIGQKMAAGDKEGAEEIKKQIGTLGSDLDAKKVELEQVMAQLDEFTLSVPNIPADEVPDGKDENDNVEISRWGEPKSYDMMVVTLTGEQTTKAYTGSMVAVAGTLHANVNAGEDEPVYTVDADMVEEAQTSF